MVRSRRDSTLTALRHLPPGAVVSEPEDPEAVPLLHGLMALADATEPAAWLTAQHRRLTARVALRAELGYLSATVTGIDRARADGPLPDDALGGVHDRLAGTVSSARWTPHDLASEEGLAAALAALRDDSDLRRGAIAWATGRHRLLADLLAATDLSDPIGWIAEHRARVAADMVLGEIAGQATRDFSFDIGDVRLVAHPMLSATAGDLRVTLRRVDFGATGTVLVADVAKPIPRMRRPTTPGGASHRVVTEVLWQGFDEMRDDCGYRYLMARYEVDTSRDGHGIRVDTARQSCFPALACSGQVVLSSAGYHVATLDLSADSPEDRVTAVSAPLQLEFTADAPAR